MCYRGNLKSSCLIPLPTQELIELSEGDQRLLWEETARVSRALKKLFGPENKLNIATLGNVVCTNISVWASC